MSEFSFPFTGGAGGQDGPYSASFFAAFLEGLFRQDETARADASYLFGSGDGTNAALAVTETSPQSSSVEVKVGKALVNGYYYFNDADKTIAISANTDGSGYDRIDTIVLEVDFINQVVVAKVVEGTAAAAPVAPTLTKSASIYQVPLADIDVANLFTTIVNADIDNTVKEPAIRWASAQGGTGLDTYALGDLLYAASANPDSLSKVNLADTAHIVIGGSPLTNIDRRTAWVGYQEASTVNGETYAKNSWLTVSINYEDDDGGHLSIATNQITFVSGTFKLIEFQGAIQSGDGAQRGHIRLRNVTAASDVMYGTIPQGEHNRIVWENTSFTANGTDAYEIQVYLIDNGTTAFGWGRSGSSGGTPPSEAPNEMYMLAGFEREY